MRELKPTGEEELSESGFADIEALAEQCKFRDCSHQTEPGCAVRAAIERGDIDEERFINYLKLRDEVVAAAEKLAVRLAQAHVKTGGRPTGKRSDDKHGKQ
jgi:ribosome biogenesis GTPase